MRPVDNPDLDHFKRVSWHASTISTVLYTEEFLFFNELI